MTQEELVQQLKALAPWHMKVELDHGINTLDGNLAEYDDPDLQRVSEIETKEMANYFKTIFPEGFQDLTFLDLGCNAGAYCFIARELGSRFSQGIDIREHWIRQARFLKSYWNIRDNEVKFDLCHVDKFLENGQYHDVTLCKGLLYHLPFPVKTLSDICRITNHVLIIETSFKTEGFPYSFHLKFESDTRIMSGVDRLSWHPGGPEVMQKLLSHFGFMHSVVTSKRIVRGDIGRMRILASRSEKYLENFQK